MKSVWFDLGRLNVIEDYIVFSFARLDVYDHYVTRIMGLTDLIKHVGGTVA